jgi:hypothetical protein
LPGWPLTKGPRAGADLLAQWCAGQPYLWTLDNPPNYFRWQNLRLYFSVYKRDLAAGLVAINYGSGNGGPSADTVTDPQNLFQALPAKDKKYAYLRDVQGDGKRFSSRIFASCSTETRNLELA